MIAAGWGIKVDFIGPGFGTGCGVVANQINARRNSGNPCAADLIVWRTASRFIGSGLGTGIIRGAGTGFAGGEMTFGVASFWDWVWVWITFDIGSTGWGADIKGSGIRDWG